MNSNEIVSTLQQQFGEKILQAIPDDKHPRIHIDASDWRAVAEFMIRDPRLQFDWLANLSGVDYVADGKLCVVYDLWSFELRHSFAVKVYCPRDNPRVPSVCDLWPAADWHERDAFERFERPDQHAGTDPRQLARDIQHV